MPPKERAVGFCLGKSLPTIAVTSFPDLASDAIFIDRLTACPTAGKKRIKYTIMVTIKAIPILSIGWVLHANQQPKKSKSRRTGTSLVNRAISSTQKRVFVYRNIRER